MNQKNKYIIASIAVIAIVFAGGLAAGKTLFQTAQPGGGASVSAVPDKQANEATSSQKTSAAMEDGTIPSGSQSADQTLSACAAALRKAAADAGTKFEAGSVLVSFRPGTALSEANGILDSLGLKQHNNPSPEDFKSNSWLTVTVPKGREFDWACTFRERPEVKYAGVNPIFDLAH
jgi:hypothetical protein